MKKLIVVIISVCLIACTTTRSMTNISSSGISEKFSNGDVVEVKTYGGEYEQVKIEAMGVNALTGSLANGETIIYLYSDIEDIREKKFSATKTAGMSLLGIFLTMVLVAYLGAEIIKEAADN